MCNAIAQDVDVVLNALLHEVRHLIHECNDRFFNALDIKIRDINEICVEIS